MSDVPPVFATLFRVIHEPHEADQPHRNKIEEDIEAEGETLPDTEHDDGEPAALDISQLQEFLLDASKGVTSDTDKEYKRCDERNFDGTMKPHDQKRDSYNHAQKMRASMTYAFGRLCGLGSLPWHESEVTGRMVGNPSVSETVATYMTSLRRRKLPTDWGGGRARRLLMLAYVLSFLCLLRFDEVLKIQMHDIEWISDTCIKLTLPFRKTNQFGGVKPFYLHLLLPHLAHLCPVRALAEWLKVSGITDGYLFRKMASGDRTSDFFLEMFRNNLLDIRIDPYPYGTHSFRRGGCQWLTEFSSLTIVKYLISYVDDPSERREDYMNPNRPPTCYCI
ncbi:hypothetical protein B0H14DRAFT_3117790 [Mycena olivaceomarginata]|nr:hypothetical protein B0H14DRAFT_3117790 [Mycena olivaceomarginata]